MEPTKVKAYGILELTRRTYVTIQVVVFAILAVAIAGSLLLWVHVDPLFRWLMWVMVGIAALEVIETVVMLAKFRAKERERSRRSGVE
jgi:membrane protein YdbS with pleckstrin-like domain